MACLPAAWALSLMLGAQGAAAAAPRRGLSGLVRAGLQPIIGESHSPFLTGPDSAPLLNTGLTQEAQNTYNLVVTPSGEVRWRARSQEYALSYGPRLFLNMAQLDTSPTIYHIISARALVGRADRVLLTLNPSLTIGGLDLGGAGSPAGSLYSGSTRPGTVGGIPSSYVSANLQGKIEVPLARRLRLSSLELFAIARSPENPELPATPQGLPIAGNLLYNMTRFDSLNELIVPGGGGTWRLQLAPGWTNFPATRSYVTLLPAVAWQRPVGRGGTLNARLGAFLYRTGVLPGLFTYSQATAIVEAGITQSLAALGLPRLRGGLSLVMGPYWDPLYGLIEPRTTLTGNLSYDWTRFLSTQLQVRYYTGRYFNFYVPPGHDLDVVISTLTLRGQLSRFVSAQLGGYTINRRLVPSRTDVTDSANDYFVFLGLDGTLTL